MVGKNIDLEDAKLANLENLTAIIKDVAKCQAKELQKEKNGEVAKSWKVTLKPTVTSLIPGFYDDLDKDSVEEELKLIQEKVDSLVKEGVAVKNNGIGQLVPIPYEVLELLFVHTSEEFRSKHFHELLDLYYSELQKHLGEKLQTIYPERLQFDLEVKTLLPVVKLELLQNNDNRDHLVEVGNNLRNYFKCTRLNQEDIYEVARRKLDSADFTLLNYELIPLKESNGHLGEYFQLKIGVRHCDKDISLDLFTKFLTPKAAHLREVLKLGPSMKEDWFYFGFLQKLKDVGLSDLLEIAPKCYFSRINDVLIMDDMSKLGYVGLTPNIKLEYGALKLAVRKLAKLHAGSFILEDILSKQIGKQIQLGDLYGKYLNEVVFNKDSVSMKGMEKSFSENVLHFLGQFPDIEGQPSDEEMKIKCEKCYHLIFEKLKASKKYRNVICHGDVYVSNMLFKFDNSGECEDVKLIDFQILRYCPPAQDLTFFLYQNALKKTLDLHFADLLNEYYTSLSEYLHQNNLDINDIYPKNVFDESIEYMKSEAIVHAIIYSRMTAIDPKIREQIFLNDKEMEKSKNDPLYIITKGLEEDHYREVMKGLTQHLVDLVV